MSRIVATGDTPAKTRNAHLRSCAEIVRLLAQRPGFGDEEQDMTAFLVFSLRGIYETIDESAQVWDDRGYWKKAEKLRDDWRWTRAMSDTLEAIVRAGDWHLLPPHLIELAGRLQDVTVTAITRDADWWCGAYRALMRSAAASSTMP